MDSKALSTPGDSSLPDSFSIKINTMKLRAYTQALQDGQVVSGRTLGMLTQNRFLVSLNGEDAVVETSVPLKSGEYFDLEFQKTNSIPTFRYLGSKSGTQTTASGRSDSVRVNNSNFVFKDFSNEATVKNLKSVGVQPGKDYDIQVEEIVDDTTVRVRISQKDFFVKVENTQLLKPGSQITTHLVKDSREWVLFGKPAHSSLSTVKDANHNLIDSLARTLKSLTNALSEVNSGPPGDKTWTQTISNKIQQLSNSTTQNIPAQGFKEWVQKTGLNLEGELKNLFLNNEKLSSSLLKDNLKSQLLNGLNRLEQGAVNPETMDSGKMHLRSLLRQALTQIESFQLTTAQQLQAEEPLLIPLPETIFAKNEQVKVYLRKDKGDEGSSDDTQKSDFKLVFLLNLSKLGPLRIDTTIESERVQIKFSSEDQRVLDLIRENAPALVETMADMGFETQVLEKWSAREKIPLKGEWNELFLDNRDMGLSVRT